MTNLDLEFVRQQFPAFSEVSLNNTAFFENAGGSYMCHQVMDRLDDYIRQHKVQPFYTNPVSSKAGDWMTESYAALAMWLNATAEEIYFGPSTSQNTYVLANSIMGWLKPGDEVIVTNQDHEANIGAWRKLSDRGIVVREWCVDPESGKLDIQTLPPLISAKTKLLTFPHCSNILGDINPVAEICDVAHQHGVRTIVDGVSFAGHGLPDFKELKTDVYLFSLYKVFGPHQGVMVIAKDMANQLNNQSHFFLDNVREKRLCPAGADHAQVAAVKGVSDYFTSLFQHHFSLDTPQSPQHMTSSVRGLLHNAEIQLLDTLLDYLSRHPAIRIIGPDTVDQRAPTISVTIKGHSPVSVMENLGQQGILCGAGHFYSFRLLQALNIDPNSGVLRFSMVHYTSREDVANLVSKLDELIT